MDLYLWEILTTPVMSWKVTSQSWQLLMRTMREHLLLADIILFQIFRR